MSLAISVRERGHGAAKPAWELPPRALGFRPGGGVSASLPVAPLPTRKYHILPWGAEFLSSCVCFLPSSNVFSFSTWELTRTPSWQEAVLSQLQHGGYTLCRGTICLGSNPGPAHTIHDPLGKSLILSMPQFPHLYNGNNSIYLRRLLGRWIQLLSVQLWE